MEQSVAKSKYRQNSKEFHFKEVNDNLSASHALACLNTDIGDYIKKRKLLEKGKCKMINVNWTFKDKDKKKDVQTELWSHP